jgi:hypothetical protein
MHYAAPASKIQLGVRSKVKKWLALMSFRLPGIAGGARFFGHRIVVEWQPDREAYLLILKAIFWPQPGKPLLFARDLGLH